MNETVLDLALELQGLRAKKSQIAMREDEIKWEIGKILEQEGVGQIVVPAPDELHEFVVKTNMRITKRFDKDGLSGRTGIDRDELDYHGVSANIEKKRLTSELVGKFQSENKSQFVTVTRRKAPIKKVK